MAFVHATILFHSPGAGIVNLLGNNENKTHKVLFRGHKADGTLVHDPKEFIKYLAENNFKPSGIKLWYDAGRRKLNTDSLAEKITFVHNVMDFKNSNGSKIIIPSDYLTSLSNIPEQLDIPFSGDDQVEIDESFDITIESGQNEFGDLFLYFANTEGKDQFPGIPKTTLVVSQPPTPEKAQA